MATRDVGIVPIKSNHFECVSGQNVVEMENCILYAQSGKGEPMALIETERLLKKIKNEYERAEVARWVNAEKPINITWSDKTARKTKLYCRKSGYLCEFATEHGYCQITVCVKEPLVGRRTNED